MKKTTKIGIFKAVYKKYASIANGDKLGRESPDLSLGQLRSLSKNYICDETMVDIDSEFSIRTTILALCKICKVPEDKY